ncbi:high mobility group box domain-containing protein [Chlamydoabsidia padenii]|nr:high mobility group box domain-containing protein [Chlamydoabsidia padenii]
MEKNAGKKRAVDELIATVCRDISKKFNNLAELMGKADLPDSLLTNFPSLTKEMETSKKKRRVAKKMAKDPLAPHRNLTSYIHFTNEARSSIVKANPDLAPRDVARKLGEEWRGLSDKQREKYNQIASEDFKRYKQETAVYQANNDQPDGNTELSVGSSTEHQDKTDGESDHDVSSDNDNSSDSDSSDTSEATEATDSSSDDD